MKKFNTTITNIKTYSKQDCMDVIKKMRYNSNNSVECIDVFGLAEHLKQGRSFHAGRFDLSDFATISCNSWISQEVFGADIDHANFTLKEVQQRLMNSGFPLKPAIIYETHSSTDEFKKYRLVFISKNPVTDQQKVSMIQQYLIFLFGQGYEDKMKIDFSCTDVARIYFGTTATKILKVEDNTFDADALVAYYSDNNIQAVYDHIFETNRPFHKKDGAKSSTKTKSSTEAKSKSPRSDKFISFNNQVILIEDNLKRIAKKNKFGKRIDYTQAYKFINSLKLSDVLGWEVGELNCCVLHHDNTPSANIVIGKKKGDEIYRCFNQSCCEGKNLSTFDVLARVFERRYKDTLYKAKVRIFKLLDIKLGSEYQLNVVEELREAKRYTDILTNQKTPLGIYLQKKKLLGFYHEMLDIADSKVLYQPISNRDEDCATFFASYSYICQQAKNHGRVGCGTKANIEKKMTALIRIGLIEKICDYDIQDEFMKRTHSEKERRAKFFLDSLTEEEVLAEMLRLNIESEAELLGIMTSKVKRVTFYRIPNLTASLLDEIETTVENVVKHDKEYRVKLNGRGVKQSTLLHGTEEAKKCYQQTEMTLSKSDTFFLDKATKAIDKLIESQGYFTEKQLLANVDRSGHFYKKDKKHLKKLACDQFLPYLVKIKNLTSITVNKCTREKYNISDKIKSNQVVYVFKD